MSPLVADVRREGGSAIGPLFAVVYDELCALARIQRRHQPSSDTLNTTALVHEAFLKLVQARRIDLEDHPHFMALASTAMRQILISHARRRCASKRGGPAAHVSLEEIEHVLEGGEPGFVPGKAEALIALDRAVTRLGQYSERLTRVVECRFFAGMSIDETALALSISPATVKRDWSLAQAWLYRDMQGSP